MENPYQSPLDDTLALPVDDTPRNYGGIGRLAYVGYSFLLYLGLMGIAAASAALELGGIAAVAGMGFFVASMYLAAQRLKNMGWQTKWILLMFVPLANVVVGFMMLICPEGYGTTRKLDTAGKVMTGALLPCIALAFLIALVHVQ